MIFPLDTASVLADGRGYAESLMTDTVTVDRPTGRTVQDEVTGLKVPVFTTEFASLCKVQQHLKSSGASLVVEGGVLRADVDRLVHFPISAPVVLPGDRLTITAIGPTTDPQLLGVVLWVTDTAVKSYATARRVPVTLRR